MSRLDQQKTAGELTRLLGTLNENLKIAKERTNTGGVTGLEFKTPKDGPGGYEEQPFDDFGDYRGPTIPNPSGGGDWAHTPWDSDSIIDKWGAVQDPSGEWMLPTKEGTLRQATEEEKIMIESDFQHRKDNTLYDGHEHQAMHNPNDTPQKMFKVTDKDRELNNPAWQQFIQGNPNYMYVPLKTADASALTDVLKNKQHPRTGSLNHLSDKERKELLIQGVAAHKA